MATPEFIQLLERFGFPITFLVLLSLGVFVTGREMKRLEGHCAKLEERLQKSDAQTETVILLADRLTRLLAAQERGRQL